MPFLGCILIAVGAFTLSTWLGFLVSGGFCWVIDWYIDAERRKR
jgi:hypothetical protein